jgi:hypothetical protein
MTETQETNVWYEFTNEVEFLYRVNLFVKFSYLFFNGLLQIFQFFFDFFLHILDWLCDFLFLIIDRKYKIIEFTQLFMKSWNLLSEPFVNITDCIFDSLDRCQENSMSVCVCVCVCVFVGRCQEVSKQITIVFKMKLLTLWSSSLWRLCGSDRRHCGQISCIDFRQNMICSVLWVEQKSGVSSGTCCLFLLRFNPSSPILISMYVTLLQSTHVICGWFEELLILRGNEYRKRGGCVFVVSISFWAQETQ